MSVRKYLAQNPLSNHMVLHGGEAILARAKKLRKARQAKIAKEQVPPKRKRGRPSKSAPAKIIPAAEHGKSGKSAAIPKAKGGKPKGKGNK